MLIHEEKRKEISESVLIDHLAPHLSTLQPLDFVKLVENYDESKLSLTGLIAYSLSQSENISLKCTSQISTTFFVIHKFNHQKEGWMGRPKVNPFRKVFQLLLGT